MMFVSYVILVSIFTTYDSSVAHPLSPTQNNSTALKLYVFLSLFFAPALTILFQDEMPVNAAELI